MSNILSKFRKEKKDYKTLYEAELNNRKLYEKRYKQLKDENIKLQKETGLADMKKKMMQLANDVYFLKKDRAKLYVQLEDLRNEKQFEILKEKESGNNGEQR